jgi:hypothetical protein
LNDDLQSEFQTLCDGMWWYIIILVRGKLRMWSVLWYL